MTIPRLIAVAALSLASIASAVPVITEVVASPANTAGGGTIVIRGTGLATATGVFIGGSSAPITLATSGYIFCTAPAGQGRNLGVQVFEGGTPSNIVSTFSYDIPRVSNLSVNSSPTGGGSTLTITGSNFGTSRTVTIGGNLAAPTGTSNHTQIQVIIPAGQGLNQPVVITCSGQTNIAAETPIFSYNAPTLTNLTSNGFTTAGGTATLTGTNLSLNPQVLINGVATTIQPGNTHTSVTFNVPPGSGGTNSVRVNVGGQLSNTLNLSYVPPLISDVQITSVPTGGGVQFTILGVNLGPASAAVVRVNGAAIPVMPSSIGHTSLQCVLLPGQGADNTITVTSGGQTSPTRFISYDPPVITKVVPGYLQTSVEQTATILGSNFGTNAAVLVNGVSVSVGTHTHESITVPVPPSTSPGIATFNVVVGFQSSNNFEAAYVCPADFNLDGSVDFFDYLDFVAAFSTPC